MVGGTQFMGRATVELLIEAGYSVTILNRGRTPNPFDAVRHVCCDRFDTAAVDFFLSSQPPFVGTRVVGAKLFKRKDPRQF